LLEPQRRNLVDSSEYLSFLAGLTSSYVDSPEGLNNDTRLTENTATSQHYAAINVSGIISGNRYAISFYVREGSYTSIQVYTQSIIMTTTASISFSSETISVGGAVAGSPFMTSVGNGWYRCGWVGTALATSNMDIYATVVNLNSGVGDGTSYIDYYGFQVEDNGAGVGTSYATSYIPTYGSSVTRVVDSCLATSVSDLIGQDQGSLFVDFVWDGLSNALSDNTIVSLNAQNYGVSNIAISNYGGSLYARVTNGISFDANIFFLPSVDGIRYKCLVTYADNDVKFYVNGTLEGVDTEVSIPALNDVYFQNNHPNAKNVNQALIFPTALTDDECIALTTL